MRNVILRSALFLTLAAIFVSCSGGGSPEIEYFPVQSEKDADWGMIGPDGKFLFKEKFKYSPSIAINGFFTVEEEDGISVYSATEKPKLVGDLEGLSSAGVMTEGMIPVARKGERISYCDREGKTLFTLEPYKGQEITSVNSMFHDGLAIFSTENGMCGAINTKGEVVIEPKYSSIFAFSEGYAGAYLKNHDSEYDDEDAYDNYTAVIINKKGEQVARIKGASFTSTMKHGLIAGIKGERCGFFNKEGEFKKMPDRAEGIGMFNEKYFVYYNDEYKYGVMNMDGEIVIRARYEYVEIMPQGNRFLCRSDNDKAFIINDQDEREVTISDAKNINVLKTESESIGCSTKFEMIVSNDHEFYLYNTNGEKITKTDFYDVRLFFQPDVDSDYCDVEKAVAEFIKPLDAKGYKGIEIGSSMAQLMSGDPEDYVSQDKYFYPDLANGYKYYCSGFVYTDSYLAVREPVYQTYTGWFSSYETFDHYDYSWNSSAFADWINVELIISIQYDYDKMMKYVVKAIKDKGYTEVRATDAYTVLRNGNTYLLVSPTDSYLVGVRIDLYNESRWQFHSAGYLSSATDRYNELKGGTVAVEEVEAAVEEAVAEATEEIFGFDSIAVAVDSIAVAE